MPWLIRLLVVLLAFQFCQTASTAAAQEKKYTEDALKQFEVLERHLLYHPRKYQPADIEDFQSRGGKRINYKTSQGEQSSWLIPQAAGAKPEKLWAFCGGNGTIAMDMESFARSLNFERDAFLLIDYPGYGTCAGQPSPAAIRETVKQAIVSGAEQAGLDPKTLPETVCVFGHSLGTAAALLGAEELKLRFAVLLAPFTTIREVAVQQIPIPKDLPLQHNFDNRAGLKQLDANKGQAWIIHGDRDETIPVTMGRTLNIEFPKCTKLTIVAGATHNDLLRTAHDEIRAAMIEARK